MFGSLPTDDQGFVILAGNDYLVLVHIIALVVIGWLDNVLQARRQRAAAMNKDVPADTSMVFIVAKLFTAASLVSTMATYPILSSLSVKVSAAIGGAASAGVGAGLLLVVGLIIWWYVRSSSFMALILFGILMVLIAGSINWINTIMTWWTNTIIKWIFNLAVYLIHLILNIQLS